MFDGPINGERFLAYVEQFLVPPLRRNDIVVLDNLGSHKGKLGSHKGKAVRKAVKAAGARLLFPPKYSPDLNPIEQAFERPRPAPPTPSPTRSPKPLPKSPQTNAPTISKTPATLPSECRTL